MLKVISDLHLGAIRSGGTTLDTQWKLRQHLLHSFYSLLPDATDLMILGDLFDTVNIPIHDVLHTYLILKGWCRLNPNQHLYLVAGNHDLSKTSNVLSSFDMLCSLLVDSGVNVKVIKEPCVTPYGAVIPHLANQELFDAALATVTECEVLFLHCNYDNKFAAQSDQSLNLSKEQAESLPVKHIVFGHEHRSRMTGKAIIPGNQVASSVSDCLGQRAKMYVTVSDEKVISVNQCPEWVSSEVFVELDWQNLEVTAHKFVRVVGTAAAEQASAVVTAISKLRQASPALVITNAVVIVGVDDTEVFEQSLDEVQGFSVMRALKELLTEDEYIILEGLEHD